MKKFVLLDFDGVLYNSIDMAVTALKKVCPTRNKEDYRQMFKGNINDADFRSNNFSHSDECRHDLDFFEVYSPMMTGSNLFPDAKQLITDLAKNYNLVIISSSLTNSIIQVLKNNDVSEFFAEVLGNDVDTSKVVKMQMVLDKYHITNKDVLFVTDTTGDIKEAKHLDIPTFAVTWGFHDRTTLEKENPRKIVDSFEELQIEINEHFMTV